MSNQGYKIRALPRAGEKSSSQNAPTRPPRKPAKDNSLVRTYVIVAIAVAAAFYLLFSDPQPVANLKNLPAARVQVDDNSPEALVNKYLQEAEARRDMAMRTRELENKASSRPLGADAAVIPQNDRQLGVSLDQENSAEKVYKDLYGNQEHTQMSPDDRINMRLQQDAWLAKTEKQERKQYVQNFLKEAYDAGYAIDLDENLVVIRVRKVTSRPKQSLDKVLENLARKGY